MTKYIVALERFSFKCRKTKTKVITLTNHNSRKQSNEPIRARSKYMSLVLSAGKRVRVNSGVCIYYVADLQIGQLIVAQKLRQ